MQVFKFFCSSNINAIYKLFWDGCKFIYIFVLGIV